MACMLLWCFPSKCLGNCSHSWGPGSVGSWLCIGAEWINSVKYLHIYKLWSLLSIHMQTTEKNYIESNLGMIIWRIKCCNIFFNLWALNLFEGWFGVGFFLLLIEYNSAAKCRRTHLWSSQLWCPLWIFLLCFCLWRCFSFLNFPFLEKKKD